MSLYNASAEQDSPSAWEEQLESGGTLRYQDRQFGCDAVKLLPGEYYVTGEDILLVTLLGSCVSACIRDPLAGVGGMNHFMLPESEMGAGAGSARYGSFAMEVLVNDLLKRGAARSRLEAKVFGGGNVLRGFTTVNVGQRNAQFVLDYLAAERIGVKAEDLGDTCPRKIHYFPLSGRVLVKRLAPAHSGNELNQEQAYRQRLQQQPVAGDIELFS